MLNVRRLSKLTFIGDKLKEWSDCPFCNWPPKEVLKNGNKI